MTPARIATVLQQYNELVMAVQPIAQLVGSFRSSYASHRRTYDISFEDDIVYATYHYTDGDSDTEEFPLSYLWSATDQIEAAETERKTKEENRLAGIRRAEKEAEEKRERYQLQRLKEKYEGGLAG